jgi:enoyl-CoA hydratase/carnithine racemase
MTENEETSETPQFSRILYAVDNRVAWITFNEPDRLNPIGHGPGSMEDELLQAIEAANLNSSVRCIVVTGSGRAFSAGGDLSAIGHLETPRDHLDFHELVRRADQRIRESDKPIIGAINGLCYGYALALVSHFDMLVAADVARFGLIETRFGGSGAHCLPYLVGAQWAKFLALTGEIITAKKAKEIGLVLEIFPVETFMAKVEDLARRVASMPPDAVMMNRRVINAALTMMGWEAQMAVSAPLNAIIAAMGPHAAALDGRRFSDILGSEGWQAYKAARDEPFTPPWLDE